jgi:hypothetical protein
VLCVVARLLARYLRKMGTTVLDQSSIERPALARLETSTVQCFAANDARHSDCVSTADGVSSAVI